MREKNHGWRLYIKGAGKRARSRGKEGEREERKGGNGRGRGGGYIHSRFTMNKIFSKK